MRLLWLVVACGCLLIGGAPGAWAQPAEYAGRPIAEVRIQGLVLVPETLAMNAVRTKAGEPYDPTVVSRDVVRLTHLGRFNEVRAEVAANEADGSVILTYVVAEQPLLADVQTVGNKAISDQELLAAVQLRSGDPADPFLIERGQQQIVDAYEEKGYFVAEVTIDRELLFEEGILIYRIREGPRVRIKDFRFEGNDSYPAKELRPEIQSQTWFPLIRGGELNRQRLELDAGEVRNFYRAEGYLDAQVGRRIDISPNEKDAVVTFVIDEGERYTIRDLRFEGLDVFPETQVRESIALKRRAIYSQDKVDSSIETIRNLYGKLGYIDTSIRIERLFIEGTTEVDLLIAITEGSPAIVGKVSVRGNSVSKSKVILRRVRGIDPGQPFDREGLERTRAGLRNTSLFRDGTVTILGGPDDEVRDVLIEVSEAQTGSITFGAGVSSDSGLVGAIDISQRNFDIADFPESGSEIISGQAFRGAGQSFSISLQPGLETSQYSISFSEPAFLESDFFFSANAFFWEREREDFDESRYGGAFGFGQRFGDIYTASARFEAENVRIDSVDRGAPVDVFEVEGDNFLESIGFTISRNTLDSPVAPGKGSVASVTFDSFGLMGGDFEFQRLEARFQTFFTVDRDFLDRKSVLSWRLELGYIFNQEDAPLFERFYAGGSRTFRGFEFRGVGPRGIRNDNGRVGNDPVGGNWMLLTGLQYEFPLFEDFLRGVVFTDQGTLREDVGLEDWRVSVGTGIRIKIPFLGQAPFAIDFAVPLIQEDGDEEQFISFDLAVPLQ
ncbi:MAG: outer membrane protein assembly factor BamA [Planctomycetota bacterium]